MSVRRVGRRSLKDLSGTLGLVYCVLKSKGLLLVSRELVIGNID